jgi:DNA-binding HxlR family transcriptional regulator
VVARKATAMSDHRAPSDHLLELLSQKAAHEIVRLLGAAERPLPFGMIMDRVPHAVRLLHSLALEGFVRRHGTWDLAPSNDTPFELTARGRELIEQLDRLAVWARERAARRSAPPRPRSPWRIPPTHYPDAENRK